MRTRPRTERAKGLKQRRFPKCHALLQQQVCVVLVDPVTTRSGNLYAELAQRLGARPPATAPR